MKRILFLFGLLVCLAGMPLTAFADNKTAKQTYETAISDNWKTMLKNSIALDTINAENNTHLLNWQDVKNPSDEAVKLVEKIRIIFSSAAFAPSAFNFSSQVFFAFVYGSMLS